MEPKLFEKLVASIQEATEIARGMAPERRPPFEGREKKREEKERRPARQEKGKGEGTGRL